MRPRLHLFILFAVALALILPGLIHAQDAPPAPERYGPVYDSPPYPDIQRPDFLRVPDDDTPARSLRSTGIATLSGEESVVLGQPGLSFWYAQHHSVASMTNSAPPGPADTLNAPYRPLASGRIFLPLVSHVIPGIGGGTGRLAFYSYRTGDDELYLMNADGSDVVRLTDRPDIDKVPIWSPDGHQIAFASWRGGWGVFVLNVDTQVVTRVTTPGPEQYPTAWDRHSNRILINVREGNNTEIWAVKPNGSELTRLTNNPAVDDCGSFSPDGSRIVFVSDRDGGRSLFSMNADGTGVGPMGLALGVTYCPDWSPDGQGVLVPYQGDIWYQKVDGGSAWMLTSGPAADTQPKWSPDGMLISFSSFLDGDNEIYVMNADGSNVRRVTDNWTNDDGADWQPLGFK